MKCRASSCLIGISEDKCSNSKCSPPPLCFPQLLLLNITSYVMTLWSAWVSCPGCVSPHFCTGRLLFGFLSAVSSPGWKSPTPCVCLHRRCASSLWIILMVFLWTCYNRSMSLYWGLQSWTQYSWRRTTSLSLLVMLLLMEPRIRLAVWGAGACYRVMLSFTSTNTPESFLSELLSVHCLPSLYLCLG